MKIKRVLGVLLAALPLTMLGSPPSPILYRFHNPFNVDVHHFDYSIIQYVIKNKVKRIDRTTNGLDYQNKSTSYFFNEWGKVDSVHHYYVIGKAKELYGYEVYRYDLLGRLLTRKGIYENYINPKQAPFENYYYDIDSFEYDGIASIKSAFHCERSWEQGKWVDVDTFVDLVKVDSTDEGIRYVGLSYGLGQEFYVKDQYLVKVKSGYGIDSLDFQYLSDENVVKYFHIENGSTVLRRSVTYTKNWQTKVVRDYNTPNIYSNTVRVLEENLYDNEGKITYQVKRHGYSRPNKKFFHWEGYTSGRLLGEVITTTDVVQKEGKARRTFVTRTVDYEYFYE